MKTLTTGKIKEQFKVSNSIALHLNYHLNLDNGNLKMYINRGGNTLSCINSLKKKFGVEFEFANDAPRGGKSGEFCFIKNNTSSWLEFVSALRLADEKATKEEQEKENERKKVIAAVVISEEDKLKYIEKVKGMSNKSARKVAYNVAAKKTGFYSRKIMLEFFNLVKDI